MSKYFSDEAINIFTLNVASKVLTLAGWSYLLSLVSRTLTMSDFGDFMMIVSIVSFATIISGLGQSNLVMNSNSKFNSESRSNEHLKNVFHSFVLLLTCSPLISFIFGLFAPRYLNVNSILISCCVAFLIFFQTFITFLSEESKTIFNYLPAVFFGPSGGVLSLFTMVLSLFSLLLGRLFDLISLTNILIVLTLSSFLSMFFLLIAFRKMNIKFKLFLENNFSFNSLKKFFSNGVICTLSSTSAFILGQSDLWIVYHFFGSSTLASYSIALFMARFTSIGSILLANSFSNRLSKSAIDLHSANFLSIYKKLNLAAFVIAFISFSLLLVAYKVNVFRNIFNVDKEIFLPVLFITSIGNLISSLWSFGPLSLLVSGNFKKHLRLSVFSVIFSVFSAYFFLKFFGILGISIAYAIGYFGFTFFSHKFLKSLAIKKVVS